MARFLAVAPHPDDEVIASGPLLVDLLAAGHTVTVLCASLGRAGDHDRRRAEAMAAAAAGGWEFACIDPPVLLGRTDDHLRAVREIGAGVQAAVHALTPDVVIGPSPDDAHHGHETVGRAIEESLRYTPGMTVWSWAFWGALRTSTLLHPFGEPTMSMALLALSMYGGEIARNDYREVLMGLARANAVLGSERVFGFGSGRASDLPYATVLLETVSDGAHWHPGAPRLLDVADPLAR